MYFEDSDEHQNPLDYNMMQLMQQFLMQNKGTIPGVSGMPLSQNHLEEQQSQKNIVTTAMSFPGAKKPYSEEKPLSDLILISISDLTEFKIHHGCYLKVKFTRPCTKIVAVQGNVEDHEGNTVDISIYNFNTRGKKFQEIFAVGTVIFVKEPFFKIALAGNRNVRIDNPRDIEFQVDPFKVENKMMVSKQIKSNQAWEQETLKEGRELMASKDYIAAYLTYKNAANKTALPEYRIKLLLNKSIVSLELNLFEEYREGVDQVIQLDPANVKANYHKIKSLILLGEFQKANKLMNKKKGIIPLDSSKQLLALLEIYKNTKLNKVNWYEALRTNKIGEYFSQKIEIAKSLFGLGIVAKENINPGEILIIQKPLLFSKDQEKQNTIVISFGSVQMQRKCEVLLRQSKHFRQKFMNLSSSERIGVAGIARQSAQLQQEEIKEIISTNSFSLNDFEAYFDKGKEFSNQHGLYQKISMINHACEENCERFCLNGTMVIYCTRQIKKGQELLTSYIRCRDLNQRQDKLSNWKIKCNCKYCQEQRWEKKHGQPKIHIQSQELRRQRLQQRVYKTKEQFSQLFSEFYDMFAVRLVAVEGRDISTAASMLRRVLKMSEKESIQIILSYLKK